MLYPFIKNQGFTLLIKHKNRVYAPALHLKENLFSFLSNMFDDFSFYRYRHYFHTVGRLQLFWFARVFLCFLCFIVFLEFLGLLFKRIFFNFQCLHLIIVRIFQDSDSICFIAIEVFFIFFDIGLSANSLPYSTYKLILLCSIVLPLESVMTISLSRSLILPESLVLLLFSCHFDGRFCVFFGNLQHFSTKSCLLFDICILIFQVYFRFRHTFKVFLKTLPVSLSMPLYAISNSLIAVILLDFLYWIG